MNNSKHGILITLYSILVKGKTHHCEPHPNTTLDKLKEFHFIEIGRRWLFQCFRDLEDDGYIKRQRRYKQNTDGEIISRSSSWVFCLKGMKYLKANMVVGAKEIVKRTIDFLHRNDERFPRPSDIFPGEELTERSVALARLQEILRDIGRKPVGGGAPATT